MELLRAYYIPLLLLTVSMGTLFFRFYYPKHRSVSALLFLFAVISGTDVYMKTNQEFSISQNISLVGFSWALLALLGLNVLYILLATKPFSSKVPNLDLESFEHLVEKDTKRAVILNNRIDKNVKKFLSEGFHTLSSESILGSARKIMPQWKAIVKDLNELEEISEKFGAFYRINPITRWKMHRQSFVMFFATHMQLYETSFQLGDAISSNVSLVNMLNAGDRGLEKNNFDKFNYRITGVVYMMRQTLGHLYYALVHRKRVKNPDLRFLIEDGLKTDVSFKLFLRCYTYNMLKYAEVIVSKLWGPTQAFLANTVGHWVLTKRGYHIQAEDVQPHIKKFLPADIMLQRRDWDVSSFGIPGYWTHATLYLGSLEEVTRYFKNKRIPELKNKDFKTYVKRRFPKAYAAWNNTDKSGFPLRIIEAKAVGNHFHSMEKSANADAICFLRAKKITNKDRFRVITQALENFDKPYDFDFNFLSQNEVMCSELVFRAYQNTELIHMQLTNFAGRTYFTPNDLIKKFDKDYGSKYSELDFILFLDGHERTKKVHVLNAKALRSSWGKGMWQSVKEYVLPKQLHWNY